MNNQEALADESGLFRLIDANLNRLKEGIRVSEDIFRYIYKNKKISSKLKYLRHSVKQITKTEKKFLQHRDIENDVLKKSSKAEKKRESIKSLVFANFKRSQEAARVLEEAFKLINTEISESFKNIRYELYKAEKEALHFF